MYLLVNKELKFYSASPKYEILITNQWGLNLVHLVNIMP
jgi:hypothetical protein